MRSLVILLAAAALHAQVPDPRHLSNGSIIPDEGYSDQPYVVKTNDGAWLCVITTGPGQEGAGGQHIVTTRSTDRGKTWSKPADVEPSNGPEASYAVMLKIPSGRVYVFYNHNTDNIRQVIGDKPAYRDGWVRRVDSLGHFVYKYSDDHGRTWSTKRYEIPQRDFEIDKRNAYQGKIKFFWTVGKAFLHKNAGYVPLHKVGGFGEGFFTSSEGVLLRSDNILTERDPEKLRWETLPEGDKGIRTPPGGGPIAEEHSFSTLSDGSLFVVFRTIDGHSAFAYSRDDGRTWSPSEYMRYADGRLMKHPRAANFAWRCENGKFVYWFHNHGGRFILEHPRRRTIAYEERNPVWLVGGVEADSPQGKIIRWSQPEVALYEDDPVMRMSYPDLVEEGGKYYLTETQKEIARVHEIDTTLLEGMWNQFDNRTPATSGLLLNHTSPGEVPMPELPAFTERNRGGHGTRDTRAGVSIDLWARFDSLAPGQILLDNRTPDGKGFVLQTAPNGAIEIGINDGRTENRWASDQNTITTGTRHHIAVIIDGGPKIITFLIDGKLHDGGTQRQFGWGRYSRDLRGLTGASTLRVGKIERARIYNRALRTSEAIANFRSAN
ncbi:MAG: exo-alpha-sialidase [Bryobacterales bacterium]|nr:exo-alpha-sialidase [Bryobacterales bacterium]